MVKAKAKKTESKDFKKNTKRSTTSIQLKNQVVNGMLEKKANDIVCIDLRKMRNAVADFFVICHADSRTHVEAISDSVEEVVFNYLNENPYHKEGIGNAEWILIDYVNVVAHIFIKDQRDFYGLEKLWADAQIQSIANNY